MKTKILFLFLAISTITYSQFWTEKISGFTETSRGINQFNIVDSNIIWATAYDGSAAGANVQSFTKSIDGGANWTVGNINLGPATAGIGIGNIYAHDQNTAWVIGFPNTAFDQKGVWKTTDGGTVWNKQVTATFSDGASFPNVVYFWDANNGFCQGDPVGGYYELYTTTDSGVNWTRVPSGNIPAPLSGEYGYVRQIEVVGNRMWWTTNKGRIFRSDDHGITHVAFQSPISDFGGSSSNGNVSFWDSNNGLLLNNAGLLWKTTDGGQNWVQLTTTGTVFNGAVTCIEGSDIAISVSGATGNSGSSYSIDGGLTWTTIDTGIQHIGVEFKHNIGFTGGFSQNATTPGGLSKYTGTELPLSTSEDTITTFKAYPNPVKDILTIEGMDTITNVTIFNMLGQKVLETSPNQNNVEINMSTFNHGAYFAKVTINNATETMKIVK